MVGFMSHLVLDEIYSVEWKRGRWRFKKSFGTALKFWGDDAWSNFSTYAKLAVVAMIILGEPSVLERLESRHPGFANQFQQLQHQFGSVPLPTAQDVREAAQAATAPLMSTNVQPPVTFAPQYDQAPTDWPFPAVEQNYGTARRPAPLFPQ